MQKAYFLPASAGDISRPAVEVGAAGGLAHAHNEKPCPVTICKGYRYEGVHTISVRRKRHTNITEYQ